MAAPRILIITTSHARMGKLAEPTGVWLEELTTPYYAFADNGAEVTLASIAGGPVPLDPKSTAEDSRKEASVKRYYHDPALQAKVADTPAFTALPGGDFDAVFMPGGHGTMWDLPDNAALGALISSFLAAGKPVAAVCHGPAGLVGANDEAGEPIVKDRKVTGFTNGEEAAMRLDQIVPFLLEDKLRELGGKYEKGPDFAPYAVRDGMLITGQNPASAARVAALTLAAVGESVTS